MMTDTEMPTAGSENPDRGNENLLEPLYTAASSMTTEAFTQMNRDLNVAGLHILQVLFVFMLLAIGSIFMVNRIYGMGWMFFALAMLRHFCAG